MGEALRQRLEILLLARLLALAVFLAGSGTLLFTGVASRALGGPAFLWVGSAFVATLLSALALRAVDAAARGAGGPDERVGERGGEAGSYDIASMGDRGIGEQVRERQCEAGHVPGAPPGGRPPARTAGRDAKLAGIAWAQLPVEIVLVAGLVALGGGARGPAVGLLVLPVLNAAAILPARGPAVAAGGGVVALALLSAWEFWTGLFGGLPALTLVAGGAVVLVLVAVAVGRLARAAAAAEARACHSETEVDAATAGRDALASALEAGVVVLDSAGRIRSANPAAQRIFGLSSMEMQSRRLAALLPGVAAECCPAGAGAADAADGAVAWLCAGPGSAPTQLRLSRVPLADAFGRAVGEIVVLNELAAAPLVDVPEEEALPTEPISLAELTAGDAGPGAADGLLGATAAMRELWRMIEKAAPTDAPVLLTGESGTGKELVARALHRHSRRAHGPFVALNCGAIPEGLIESELFGHVRGAFTGATADRPGLFRRAQGGTIFLDEIGELPARLQVRLLRVLQERVVVPVGGGDPLAVDVRVIAATNRDLHAGRHSLPASLARRPPTGVPRPPPTRNEFRDDLYYRIAVLALVLPALRERRDDLPRLVAAFVQDAAGRHGRSIGAIERAALEALCHHPFPGNVRELENSLEHAVTLADGGTLRLADLPDAVRATMADTRGSRLIHTGHRALDPAASAVAHGPTGSARAAGLAELRHAPTEDSVVAGAFAASEATGFSGSRREASQRVPVGVGAASEAPRPDDASAWRAGSARDADAIAADLDGSQRDPDPLDDAAFCLDEFLERRERALILAALDRSKGVRTRAAELLGIGYRSLRHRLARLDLG